MQKKNITPLYNPSNVTIAAHDPSNKSINNRPQNVKNGQMPRKKLRRSSLGGGLVFGWWQIREREPCYGYRNLTKLNVKPSPSR